MPTNMNLVRKINELERVKVEIETRRNRANDEDGYFASELFQHQNPDIDVPAAEWFSERLQEAKKLQDEVDDLQGVEDSFKGFEDLQHLGRQPTAKAPYGGVSAVRLSDELVKSEAWDEFRSNGLKNMTFNQEVGLKTLFETTAASGTDMVSVESVRTGDYVPAPRTRVTLFDVIPQIPTTATVVKFDRETKNESAAAPIAQGAVYAESAFQIDEIAIDVSKVGTFIQVSEEVLDDVPELRARLDGSLMGQLMRRVQSDIVGGVPIPASEYVGTPVNNANVTGFTELTGINAIDGNAGQASGEFINQIRLLEEAQEVVYRVGEADADAIVMNSQDWYAVTSLQSTTGAFIARGALSGIADPTAMMVAGLPVILCNALPQHTVLVGAFREHSAIRDRQAAQVRIQEAQHVPSVTVSANATAITQTQPTGRFNIFADARFAFYARRASAFCQITDFGNPAP